MGYTVEVEKVVMRRPLNSFCGILLHLNLLYANRNGSALGRSSSGEIMGKEGDVSIFCEWLYTTVRLVQKHGNQTYHSIG